MLCIAIAVPPKGGAVIFGPGGSFAKEDKKEGCQRWETGANDAKADFDAGPELRAGTGV